MGPSTWAEVRGQLHGGVINRHRGHSVRRHAAVPAAAAGSGAQALDTSHSVLEYVQSKPDLMLVLHGQPSSPLPPATAMPLTEGKINYAWDVAGAKGAFFLKYYVRSVGPEFPLSQVRCLQVVAACVAATSLHGSMSTSRQDAGSFSSAICADLAGTDGR